MFLYLIWFYRRFLHARSGFCIFYVNFSLFYMKQRIAEDLKDALSLWPNDVPTIMFYNIIDLLQMKVFFSSLISNYGSAFYFCLYNLFVSIFRVQWKMCTRSSTCRSTSDPVVRPMNQ